ncbi:MAG: hypothetical protein AAGG81_00815 [Chlamydiota bacterium]
MLLKIFEKHRPFSHRPGTRYVLPGTSLVFTLFPTLIRWHDLSSAKNSGELKLQVTGPVEGFTSQLDLERGFITVWGHAKEGYYKYRIQPDGQHFSVTTFKNLTLEGEYKESGQSIQPPEIERLHLGVSKKQDWELIQQRCDLKELIPIWYAMSQYAPICACDEIASLYQQCNILIEHREIEKIGDGMRSLFKAGFSGVFVPRLQDDDHNGFTLPPFVSSCPIGLLSASRQMIRKLFVQLEENRVHILPALPVDFHCGKFIQIRLGEYGELDIEWTKKTIRRLIFRCKKDTELQFLFQNHLKRFRSRAVGSNKSRKFNCGETLEFLSDKTYLFDNFQK